LEKGKKPIYKKWWFWILIIVLLIALIPRGENNQADENTKTETEEKSGITEKNDNLEDADGKEEDQNATSEETGKSVRIKAGVYEVGPDIKPGLYKSEGNITYWARLSGFGGSLDEIIANGNPVGSDIVQIDEGDKGFETRGTGYWYPIGEDYQPEIQSTFGDGTYIVGKDIAPGKYKCDGGGYWARLSGFSGEFHDIIANDNTEGPTIVEILESDIGFQTWGNGTWTKIE